MPNAFYKLLLSLGILAAVIFTDWFMGPKTGVAFLYLAPVILATAFFGLPFGLFVAIVALAGELVANFKLEVPLSPKLMLQLFFNFLIFVGTAVIVDRYYLQERAVSELKQSRSYDIDLAKQVHHSVFLPLPQENDFLSCGHKVVFTKELGGDYCYWADLDEQVFYCLADISGKSIAAALFSILLHQTIIDALQRKANLSDIVQTVNTRMYAALPEDMFITMFCCFISREEISYINAGHEPPLVYSKEQNKVGFLLSNSPIPLGMHPFLEIGHKELYFTSGDILLAVTDGVTDSEHYRDNPFRKLQINLMQSSDFSADNIADNIYRSSSSASPNFPMDDIVITCIKRKFKI